jgi:hypothetical protein
VTKKKGFLLRVLLSRWFVGRNPGTRTKLRVKPWKKSDGKQQLEPDNV